MKWTLALLVACNGHSTDIQPTLRFADRSDAEIQRLIGAAVGFEIDTAEQTLHLNPGDPCPMETMQGTMYTFSGGCTTQSGVAIDGTASFYLAAASRYHPEMNHGQWNRWTLKSAMEVDRFDGHASWMVASWAYGGEADLTVDLAGVAVRSDISYTCNPPPNCDSPACGVDCTPEGSGVELVGVGGALVSGSWHLPGGTSLTLQGADTLTVTNDGYQITP